MDRGMKKNFYFRFALNCTQNFRENNTEALAILKRLRMTEQIQILQRRLGCICKGLQVLWIA